jgi:hypothetical protein
VFLVPREGSCDQIVYVCATVSYGADVCVCILCWLSTGSFRAGSLATLTRRCLHYLPRRLQLVPTVCAGGVRVRDGGVYVYGEYGGLTVEERLGVNG